MSPPIRCSNDRSWRIGERVSRWAHNPKLVVRFHHPQQSFTRSSMVERSAVNRLVVGSSPTVWAKHGQSIICYASNFLSLLCSHRYQFWQIVIGVLVWASLEMRPEWIRKSWVRVPHTKQIIRVWPELVTGFVWDEEYAGSSPVTLTLLTKRCFMFKYKNIELLNNHVSDGNVNVQKHKDFDYYIYNYAQTVQFQKLLKWSTNTMICW